MELIKEELFRKQLKKGLSGGYLFFGEEDYLKSFSLRSAREAVCAEETFAVFNDVRIDPMDYSATSLVNALMPPPMMADKKIVTIDGLAICDMKASEIEELCEALSTLEEYDYNVLIISVPAGLMDEGNLPKNPSKTFKALSNHLTPVQFDSVVGSRLIGWVGKHFEHHGVKASPQICSVLAERCGKSMFILASETEKISYYVKEHGRNEVTAEDVDNISSSVISSDAYAFANAILDEKSNEAIKALEVMKFRRIDPVIILAEVSRVMCELLHIKRLHTEGLSAAEINKVLNLRSEYRTKLYITAASSKSEKKLKRAILLCAEADRMLKLSPQGYTAIEKLVCFL